jgi:hypothetical protein
LYLSAILLVVLVPIIGKFCEKGARSMANTWLEKLKGKESKENTTAAMGAGCADSFQQDDENSQTTENLTSKNGKMASACGRHTQMTKPRTDKNSKIAGGCIHEMDEDSCALCSGYVSWLIEDEARLSKARRDPAGVRAEFEHLRAKEAAKDRGQAWDGAKATDLARRAYQFIAKVFPKDVDLGVLDDVQDAVLTAQGVGDFPAYEEALRDMCAVALREARAVRTSVE